MWVCVCECARLHVQQVKCGVHFQHTLLWKELGQKTHCQNQNGCVCVDVDVCSVGGWCTLFLVFNVTVRLRGEIGTPGAAREGPTNLVVGLVAVMMSMRMQIGRRLGYAAATTKRASVSVRAKPMIARLTYPSSSSYMSS